MNGDNIGDVIVHIGNRENRESGKEIKEKIEIFKPNTCYMSYIDNVKYIYWYNWRILDKEHKEMYN